MSFCQFNYISTELIIQSSKQGIISHQLKLSLHKFSSFNLAEINIVQ